MDYLTVPTKQSYRDARRASRAGKPQKTAARCIEDIHPVVKPDETKEDKVQASASIPTVKSKAKERSSTL